MLLRGLGLCLLDIILWRCYDATTHVPDVSGQLDALCDMRPAFGVLARLRSVLATCTTAKKSADTLLTATDRQIIYLL